jgi:hypothetical protein
MFDVPLDECRKTMITNWGLKTGNVQIKCATLLPCRIACAHCMALAAETGTALSETETAQCKCVIQDMLIVNMRETKLSV